MKFKRLVLGNIWWFLLHSLLELALLRMQSTYRVQYQTVLLSICLRSTNDSPKLCHFSLIIFLYLVFRANPEFRKKLINTVPGSEPLLKIFLQEEGNVVSEASKSISNATQKVIGVKDSIVGYFGDDKPSKSAEKAPTTTAAPSKSMTHLFCSMRFQSL